MECLVQTAALLATSPHLQLFALPESFSRWHITLGSQELESRGGKNQELERKHATTAECVEHQLRSSEIQTLTPQSPQGPVCTCEQLSGCSIFSGCIAFLDLEQTIHC